MSNFHNWIVERDSIIKENILKIIEGIQIDVKFLGYYIENNDYSYSTEPKPIYNSLEEYRIDNPKYGVINHIRYFFELKRGQKKHTLSVSIDESSLNYFHFSIEEFAEGFDVFDVNTIDPQGLLKNLIEKKFSSIIDIVDKNQNKINSYGKLSDEVLNKINYKIRLDWNYYSNRMEGGTLTRPETKSVMAGVGVAEKTLEHIKEMEGHDKVVQEILQIAKGNLRISERRIKDMHKLIMSPEKSEDESKIGKWKGENNEVINYRGEKQVYLDHSLVIEEIHKVLNKVNAELDLYFADKKTKKHPLHIATDFHLEYLYIHPFFDGNGRTARLLTNLILIACDYPPIIITDATKATYYRLLSDVQTYNFDKTLFYDFMGKQLMKTQEMILNAIAGKDISDEDDLEKIVALVDSKVKGINRPELEIEKTETVIKNTLESVYYPLLDKINSALEKPRNWFRDKNVIIKATNRNANRKDFTDFTKEDIIRMAHADTTFINAEFRLIDLKKGFDNTLLKTIFVTIEFEKYHYKLIFKTNGVDDLRYRYDEKIPEETIKHIAQAPVKKMVEDINQIISQSHD
tara:strand:- start:3019 stop:4740 length:1722 start_codon:yes stop_codon:yes gene_type:complete